MYIYIYIVRLLHRVESKLDRQDDVSRDLAWIEVGPRPR